MAEKYYLDTSIWLDLFEDRDEPNLPKGEWAQKLLEKITKIDATVVYSDIILFELGVAGYAHHELTEKFKPLKSILLFVEATEKRIGKAKDLSLKRSIPQGDALHALIARDNKAILVTLDKHFQELLDITKPKRPRDLI
jgi:predicted nucleic acid-binding protein